MATLKRIASWLGIGFGALILLGIILAVIAPGEAEPEVQRPPLRPPPAEPTTSTPRPPPEPTATTPTRTATETEPTPEPEPAPEPTPPPPPLSLPAYISIQLNSRYDDISLHAVEQAVAEVALWYQNEIGLVAEVPSIISFEPECNPDGYSEVLGYATPGIGPSGEQVILVCVRLDEDRDAALQEGEFRWLLAHEYFHVLQANAEWEYEDYELSYGGPGRCGLHMVEGSAEFFGQHYAWGQLRSRDLLSDLVSRLDWQRYHIYEDGAQALAALVRLHGRSAVTFWESDEARCADEFLTRFDVSPSKWEESWREISQR